MPDLPEFKPPHFLLESEEDIHKRMIENTPTRYAKSEGSYFWDITRPVAIEKARMIQFQLLRTVQLMFPQFAEDEWLDLHAGTVGLVRRPPTHASGVVTFEGIEGTTISEGTFVSTAGDGNEPPIRFITKELAIINANGFVDVPIQAEEPGSTGNVSSDSIIMLESTIEGVLGLTNQLPTSDGTDEESDESLRARILAVHREMSLSGSVADYIRWAKEVPGVGDVYVIPEWNSDVPGSVLVLILDSNGAPAGPTLIDEVQTYIAPDARNGGGLAPIGALVTVDAPQQVVINLTFDAVLEGTANKDEAENEVKRVLSEYFQEVSVGGLVVYARIGSLIISLLSILDYQDLRINGQTENIQLEEFQIAVIGEVLINDQ
ncbi:baseplate J/gp47 family protein [Halalkalibacter sp. AB-rgal2]|uniref:baseplate J/gp47 family protein n=1 Tax=Halalkalibacter sp. AB-rgal2 TaxID=3242695 RepID=UPI00359E5003